jgi:hypothetical protein
MCPHLLQHFAVQLALKQKTTKQMKLTDFPNGTLILYRKKLYFLSRGLEARIVTRSDDGVWQFIHNLNWKKFDVIYSPNIMN